MKIKHIIFAFFLACSSAVRADNQSWIDSLWQQVSELASSVVEKTKQLFTTSSVPSTVQEKTAEVTTAVGEKLNQVGEKITSAVKEVKEEVQAELANLNTAPVTPEVVTAQPLEKADGAMKPVVTEVVVAEKTPEKIIITEGIEAQINQPTTKAPTDPSKAPAVFTAADKKDLENQLNQQLPAQVEKTLPAQSPTQDNALTQKEKKILDELVTLNEDEQKQMWEVIKKEIASEAEKMPAGEKEQFLNAFEAEVASEAKKLAEPELITETFGTKTVSVPVSTPQQENRELLKELESLSEVEQANIVE